MPEKSYITITGIITCDKIPPQKLKEVLQDLYNLIEADVDNVLPGTGVNLHMVVGCLPEDMQNA